MPASPSPSTRGIAQWNACPECSTISRFRSTRPEPPRMPSDGRQGRRRIDGWRPTLAYCRAVDEDGRSDGRDPRHPRRVGVRDADANRGWRGTHLRFSADPSTDKRPQLGNVRFCAEHHREGASSPERSSHGSFDPAAYANRTGGGVSHTPGSDIRLPDVARRANRTFAACGRKSASTHS